MKMMLTAVVLALSVTAASAQQTRFYASDGKSLGTSTTTSSGTTFYGARGNVTGRTSGPAPSR
jgi:hypothetical protein